MIVATLLAIASTLVMLGGAIRFAHARSRDRSGSSDQSRRILLPAFAFTFGVILFGVLALVGWSDPVFLVMTTIAAFIINGLGSLILISATDVAAKAMGARRTRPWLIVGMAVFTSCAGIALMASAGVFSGGGIAALSKPDFAALIALAAAAALIWWGHLPADPAVADVFE